MVNHTKLAADEFVAEVGIDPARIEQVNPVTKLATLRLNPLQFDLRAMQLASIVTPGQNAVGAKDNIAREE